MTAASSARRPRVAIDMLASLSGGALNYLRNLLPLFAQRGTFDYTLVLRASQATRLGDVGRALPRIIAPEATVRPLTRLSWSQAALPALLTRARTELLFAPTDHPPLWVPCPLVMAVRNPTPYTEVDTVHGLGRRTRERVMRAWTRMATLRARRVIFVSQSAADVINAHLRVPAEKLRVIHHGLDETIARGVSGPLPKGVAAPYALAVSSFYRYKNYLGLLRALEILRDQHGLTLPTVLCGREIDTPNVQAVRDEIARKGLPVRLMGELEPAALSVLYRNARVLCFPSWLETFGHPLVEAMASGTPVVAGDIPTSRELCDDAALYFDPHDSQAMARQLRAVWTDGERAEQMRVRGLARSQHFSWAKTATETEETLTSALG